MPASVPHSSGQQPLFPLFLSGKAPQHTSAMQVGCLNFSSFFTQENALFCFHFEGEEFRVYRFPLLFNSF